MTRDEAINIIWRQTRPNLTREQVVCILERDYTMPAMIENKAPFKLLLDVLQLLDEVDGSGPHLKLPETVQYLHQPTIGPQPTIWGFYEDKYPVYTDYAGAHPDLGSPMTVEEANGLVDKIKQMEAGATMWMIQRQWQTSDLCVDEGCPQHGTVHVCQTGQWERVTESLTFPLGSMFATEQSAVDYAKILADHMKGKTPMFRVRVVPLIPGTPIAVHS